MNAQILFFVNRFIVCFFISFLFFSACSTKENYIVKAKKSVIPTNDKITVTILSIDTFSTCLYKMVRFHYKKGKCKGIILVEKSEKMEYHTNQSVDVVLCDVIQYSEISKTNDTVLIFNSLKKCVWDTIRKGIDTVNYRGDFILYAKFKINNSLILDFSDQASEPIFKICK